MRSLPTRLSGPVLIEPVVHGDARGFFLESFRADVLPGLGITDEFLQDNHSRSRHGVVRGMHFQRGMSKLVRCARGAILDVVVDVRRGSETFGPWGLRLPTRITIRCSVPTALPMASAAQ